MTRHCTYLYPWHSRTADTRLWDRMSTRAQTAGLVSPCAVYVLLGTVLLGAGGITGGRGQRGRSTPLCREVHSRCFGRDGCKFALENYFMSCLDLSEDGPAGEREEAGCTDRCKRALIMLLSSEEHDGPSAFRDCDCEGEEFCLRQKQRMSSCAEDVQSWLVAVSDPLTPISCSLAGLVCSADTPCLAAIEYYHNHCKKLIQPHNPRCTSRCNNSLNILYRQTKAQKLRTCFCDGTELYNCTALKDNTETLCRGTRPRPHDQHETSTHVRHPDKHDHTRGCDQDHTPPATPPEPASHSVAPPSHPSSLPSTLWRTCLVMLALLATHR